MRGIGEREKRMRGRVEKGDVELLEVVREGEWSKGM